MPAARAARSPALFAVALNPGFVLILAAIFALAAPRGLGAPTIAGAAFAALWLLLDHEFGAAAAMAQMGLPVVLLDLDALNRIFGIALLMALIVTATYSGARRNRFEDAAILLLGGGSISALFVGDLISFVAAASLAGFAAAWTVFTSPRDGASEAGVRLLMWQGLEGLLYLIGVAFQLAAGGGRSVFTHLSADSIGGGFIFAALMIRVGAPLAHVWLKDVVSHASPIGGAALSVFTSMLGVYALARFFPSESLLVPIGAAMMVVGAFFASAEDDLRKIAAYALTAQTGVSVALIGVGSPLALAGAQGHAFAAIVAFLAVQMALGNIVERTGHAEMSGLKGVARAMPISAALALVAGLAASATPGFALYAVHTVALDASAQWDLRGLWALISGLSAILIINLVLRPAFSFFDVAPKKFARVAEAPFSMLLGTSLAAFFCVAIGVAPGWLYSLMPTELSFQPYAPDRLVQHVELLSAGGALFLIFRVLRVAPQERAVELRDVDAVYRGPAAAAGRWLGVVLLRVYGAVRVLTSDLLGRAARDLAGVAATFDQPYTRTLAGGAQWVAIGLMIAIVLFAN